MVLRILQVEAPDIEFGLSLFVNQRVAFRWNGRPGGLAHRTIHRARYAACCRDSPQTRLGASMRREKYFAAVGRPCGRAHDRTVVKCQALGFPAGRSEERRVITDASDRS